MPPPATPTTAIEQRLDVLVAEVGALRRQLDAVGLRLGVEPVTCDLPAAPLAEEAGRRAEDRDVAPATCPDEPSEEPTAQVPTAQVPAAGPRSAAADPVESSGWPSSSLTPARLLAAGGAIVTILGVGFLLAVAIAAGLFGPVPRVLSLVALALTLGVISLRARPRSPDASVALAATSAAAGFGVIVAATTLYHWFPHLLGIGAALTVSVAGAVVAHRWRSELLACLLQVEVFLVLPIVLVPLTPAARVQLLLFTTLAYAPVVRLVHEHRWLRLFRVSGAILLLVAVSTLVTLPAVGAGALGWVGLAGSWLVVLLVLAHAVLVEEPAVAAAGLVVSAGAAVVLHDRVTQAGLGWGDAGMILALAVLLAAVAWRSDGRMRDVLAVGAGIHLLLATGFLDVSRPTVVVLLAAESLLLLAAARRSDSPHLVGASVVFTALALLASPVVLSPFAIVWAGFAAGDGSWQGVALGAVLGVVGALHLRLRHTLAVPGLPVPRRSVAAAFLGLYGASLAVVSLGTLPEVHGAGVMLANVVVTILWVGAALAMLLTPRVGLTRVGYVVLGLAIGKLFLADLHAVDGVLRAVLFVLTGLALIAASSGIRRSAPTAPTLPATGTVARASTGYVYGPQVEGQGQVQGHARSPEGSKVGDARPAESHDAGTVWVPSARVDHGDSAGGGPAAPHGDASC